MSGASPSGLRLVRLLVRRMGLLLGLPTVAAGLAFAVVTMFPDQWRSSAMIRLNVHQVGPAIPGVEGGTNQYALASEIATKMQMFKTRRVVDLALDTELHTQLTALAEGADLALPNGRRGLNPLERHVADFDGSGFTRQALQSIEWKGLDTLHHDARSIPEAEGFIRFARSKRGPYSSEGLASALAVKLIRDSDLVTVSISGEDRVMVSRLLGVLVSSGAEMLREVGRLESGSRRAFFEMQADAARVRLSERETRLKRLLTSNDIANYTDQTRALALHIEDTRMQIAQAEKDRARFSQRRSGIEDALGGVATIEGVIPDSENDAALLELGRKRAAERATAWTQKNVFQLSDEVDEPEESAPDRVDTYMAQHVGGLAPHREALAYEWLMEDLGEASTDAGSDVLRKHLEESVLEMERFAALGSEIHRMEREIRVAEEAYLELLESLNAATLYAHREDDGTPFSVVDPASVPDEPLPRQRTLTALVVALMVGGVVGLLVVLGDQVDRSLRTPSQLEEAYGLPVLGGLPMLARPGDLANERSTISLALMDGLGARVFNLVADAEVVQVVSLWPHAGKSTVADVLGRWRNDSLNVRDTRDLALFSDALHVEARTVSVLVVPTGTVFREADERALRDLEDAGAPVIGLVMNRLSYAGVEELMGSVPRSRSALREWAKRIVMLRLQEEEPWHPEG